jgi:hypothetical protein
MFLKEYLGDGVYAELVPVIQQARPRVLKLTTENGIETTNTIYLEPEVIDALLDYLKRRE